VCENQKQHFIKLWQSNPDVFNSLARLKNPQDFDDWWEKSDIITEMIDRAVKNFVDGVRNGDIERRFIPGHPDTFILNGGIQRYQEPSKKPPGRRISNDNVEDVSQYFREA
jgi:hypothetical protein